MHSGHCKSCDKLKYQSRVVARKLVKTRFPSGNMRAYQCPVSPYFHVGHLSRLKLAGLE